MARAHRTLSAFTALLCLVGFVGCGKSDSSQADAFIATLRTGSPAAGKIDGFAWEFSSGRAEPDPYYPGNLRIELWNEYVSNPCTAVLTSDRKILFSIPDQTADYSLGNTVNFTLYAFALGQNKNVVVTQGVIRISEITDTYVAGALNGSSSDANQINGSFNVELCPSY